MRRRRAGAPVSTLSIPLGPVIAAVGGIALENADRVRLRHPLVGGVTLFARNYASEEQVRALCEEIHALRSPRLLIAVDHEGGRVQRFRDGFTRLPAMRRIGEVWDGDRRLAYDLARAAGTVMAIELRRCGVDLSFAPVLDIDHGASTIIANRAFHSDPVAVTELASALLDGMQGAGMAGVGKHFPGHGYIAADSHLELPIDQRDIAMLRAMDLKPFHMLAGKLRGIMPAHVLYPSVDDRPAGFSSVWLNNILRAELGFEGAIFSDDLSMEGAAGEGGMAQRAHAALSAGCDLVLACTPQAADLLLHELRCDMPTASRQRLMAMFGDAKPTCESVDIERRLAAARALLSNTLA